MTRLIRERKPLVAGLERRLFLRQTLSLGALTLLSGCDISDGRRAGSPEADVAMERPRPGVSVSTPERWRRPTPKATSYATSATTLSSPLPTPRSSPPPIIVWNCRV